MRLWIDIDNSPHVPFFAPIIAAMQERGDEIFVTSRRYAQTRALLEKAGIAFSEVSAHAGANTFRKVVNLLHRSWQLAGLVRDFQPDVAVSHGSRALSLTAKALGIPNVLFFDYEWTEMQIFKRCADVLACPVVLPEESLRQAALPLHKIRRYDGFKEELYLPSFVPDPAFRARLDIPDDKVMVTVRPSSMTSNYHDSRSEDILAALIRRFASEEQAIAVVTPRTEVDAAFVQRLIQEHSLHNVRIATEALPGMQLLYWSDVVVSGGGTMNREAALLGTQTVSMFTGKRPAIDDYLASVGKLRFVERPEQIPDIPFQRHQRETHFQYRSKGLVEQLLGIIDQTASATHARRLFAVG